MADAYLSFINANEEISQLLSEIDRPVHTAVSSGKILCPDGECSAKKEFFEENGINHHFRIKHKREFTISERNEAQKISKKLHEEETMKCMEKIFEYRRTKVTKLCRYCSKSKYSTLI